MKITVRLELLADNEIQFYDTCKRASDVLLELADKAIREGDHEQFANSKHYVFTSDAPDSEKLGEIKIGRS